MWHLITQIIQNLVKHGAVLLLQHILIAVVLAKNAWLSVVTALNALPKVKEIIQFCIYIAIIIEPA
jgi:hypothetical protein